jgi:D(-)-tartrate dehydratase
MKIVGIQEEAIKLNLSLSNSMFSFKEMTTSIVKVTIDNGSKLINGYAFNSTGRYACGAQMRNRFIPRILDHNQNDILRSNGDIDTKKVVKKMLTGEKPGGDMERSVAIGTIEIALWDALAKNYDLPLYKYINNIYPEYNTTNKMFCYVGGGYYDEKKTLDDLAVEVQNNFDNGYRLMKIKVGGAPIKEDIERIERVIKVTGSPEKVALDANGGLTKDNYLEYAKQLSSYGLRWFEEPVQPSDYEGYNKFIEHYGSSVAGGENLYSEQDIYNLIKHGGFRVGKDVLQIDMPQSYGISYFKDCLDRLKQVNWSLDQITPHGGNQMSLHIACGFGLSMCEAYPNVFGVFSGYDDSYIVNDGYITLSDRPGIGFEGQNDLFNLFSEME